VDGNWGAGDFAAGVLWVDSDDGDVCVDEESAGDEVPEDYNEDVL